MLKNYNCVCVIGNINYLIKVKSHFGIELNYFHLEKEKFSIKEIKLILCKNSGCIVVLQKEKTGIQKMMHSNNIKYQTINLNSNKEKLQYLNRKSSNVA